MWRQSYVSEPRQSSSFHNRDGGRFRTSGSQLSYSQYAQTKTVNGETYYAVPSGQDKKEQYSTELESQTETGLAYSAPPRLAETSESPTDPPPIPVIATASTVPALAISPFWIGLMVAIIVIILMNVVTIVLGSLAIEASNGIHNKYKTIKTNVEDQSNNQISDCMSCDISGDPDGSYKATIESVMNNNVNVPTGFVQFSPNGIEIDNILFTNVDSSSANSNTNILFENTLGASQNLFSSVPGFVTVPISNLGGFQLTQYCSAIKWPILFTYYDSITVSFNLCTCTPLFQKCVNLS